MVLFSALVLVQCAPAARLRGGDDDQPTVVCVVQYDSVLPGVDVGSDGCGTRWLRQGERCWYWNREDGIVVEVHCPAVGDTLYVGK